MELLQLLAAPALQDTALAPDYRVHVPVLSGSEATGYGEGRASPRILLMAALPSLTPADRTGLLAALGITIDHAAGEVLVATASGQKRLLLGDPVA